MSDKGNATYYEEVTTQIWIDEDGKVLYSVVKDFSDTEDDHEVVAYGEALNVDHAARLIGDELRAMFP